MARVTPMWNRHGAAASIHRPEINRSGTTTLPAGMIDSADRDSSARGREARFTDTRTFKHKSDSDQLYTLALVMIALHAIVLLQFSSAEWVSSTRWLALVVANVAIIRLAFVIFERSSNPGQNTVRENHTDNVGAENPHDQLPIQDHGSLDQASSIGELEDERIRLTRQSQQLVEIAEKNLREKAVAERQKEFHARFIASVSHDLRTPLNAVIGFSGLMRREAYGPLGDPRYQEYAGHILDSGYSLLKSVDDVLALNLVNGPNDLQRESIDGQQLIRSCWQHVSQDPNFAKIIVIFEAPDAAPEPSLWGNYHALRQAIVNLLALLTRGLDVPAKLLFSIRNQNDCTELSATLTIDSDHSHSAALHSALGLQSLNEDVARSLIDLSDGRLDIIDCSGHSVRRVVCRLPSAAAMMPVTEDQLQSANLICIEMAHGRAKN